MPKGIPAASWKFPRRLLLAWHFVLQVSAVLQESTHPDGRGEDLAAKRPKVWSNDSTGWSCELPARSKRRSGVCRDDVKVLQKDLKFCGKVMNYRACVPAHQPLWPSWNATRKDQELAILYETLLEQRLTKEFNESPEVYTRIHYISNPECMSALKNLLCWYNFPKCSDANVSLPLCRTSCEQYYAACNFDVNDTDGRFDFCREDYVKRNGLFESGSPGPDQELAEDTEVCRSTEAIVDAMLETELTNQPWMFTTEGIVVISVVCFIASAIAFYLLVPDKVRFYMYWVAELVFCLPYRVWRQCRDVCGFLIALAVVSLIIGISIFAFSAAASEDPALSAGNETSTYKKAKDIVDKMILNVYLKSPKDKNWTYGFNITNQTEDEAEFQMEMNVGLTQSQIRQLIGSCTCTGGARRLAFAGVFFLLWPTTVVLLGTVQFA